jgi:DNA-binding transcriptional MerR regulator
MANLRRRQSSQHTVTSQEIPDKLYFKIGEVADLVGVETHVLRYWEKEIPFIRPTKTVSNQRRYRRKDVDMFREISRLLHEERYTLAGARRYLLGGGARVEKQTEPQPEPISARVSVETNETQQLALGFTRASEEQRVAKVKSGLKDLIRLAGEEP